MRILVTVDILSFWRVGTGHGQSSTFDAVCARDADRLPYVPGRQMRGLFREAVTDAIELEWLTGLNEVDLFGSRSTVDAEDLGPASTKGTLRFENSRLPRTDRDAIRADQSLIDRLFDTKRSTSIDAETMTAKARSLRFEEVAIPLKLFTTITPLTGAPVGWDVALITASPLIRGVGSGRNRGLGRCRVTCKRLEAVDA